MRNMKTYHIGDIDEFYCDAVPGDLRWAVWSQETLPLGNTVQDCRARDRGAVSRVQTTLLGRFKTEEEAESYVRSQT